MRLDDAIAAAAPPGPTGPTDLYRYFRPDGELLYVGISKSAVLRAMQHERAASWWDTWALMTRERYDDRAAALVAEREAIITEQPAHNIVHLRRCG